MKYVGVLAAAVLLVWGVVCAQKAREARRVYEASTQRLATYAGADMLAKYKLSEWAQKLSFGIYTNTMRDKIAALENKRQTMGERSRRWSLIALGLMLAAAAAGMLISLRGFVLIGAAVAGVLLYFGLTVPLMSVTLHKNVPYLGDVVFSYESKTLVGAIGKLWHKGDRLVAGLIVLFSVAVPVLKSVVMMSMALLVDNVRIQKAVAFFKHLGKWSMLDVFVVAVLLVFLSLKSGDVSRADIAEGLYFFVGYVLLSIVVSLAAERMLEKRKEM